MKYGRWLMWSLVVAAPVAGLTGYELTAAGQAGGGAPGVAAVPAAPAAAEGQATREIRIELKKSQIQAALSEKVAQVKEDEFKVAQAKGRSGQIGEDVLLSAELDATMARADADVAKVNMEEVDTQLRSGQIGPQNPNQPATQTTIQLLRLEVKKAQLQAGASGKAADIRKKQYDRETAQLKAGQSTAEKVSDAMLDLEAAKATAEIAALDMELMDSRVTAATGGGR